MICSTSPPPTYVSELHRVLSVAAPLMAESFAYLLLVCNTITLAYGMNRWVTARLPYRYLEVLLL